MPLISILTFIALIVRSGPQDTAAAFSTTWLFPIHTTLLIFAYAAFFIVFMSPRKDKPFVAINCSAIPESLMESELFGHEKGAFTGAASRRQGCFELADTGTLLLDEIGEMPALLQAKLLRAIEERAVRRLGSHKEILVDVRLLAATNRQTQQAVSEGKLRSDLLYRLNVFSIHLPPLSERKEDLPLLAQHLVTQLAAKHVARG